MTADPFGTRALRDAALAAWARSPARLREDANAEEDHARGWYRDRVVVELAQNAADAAARTGVPGSLVLELRDTADGAVLVATNTGAPLDADGVAALASLRASAKRDGDGTVGRFGVGFAAVRSVADEVAVVSRDGAVHFSLERTRDALTDVPEAVAAEVARRGDWLPVLRLPFESAGRLAAHVPRPDGWVTAVVLAVRPGAVADVRALLDAVDDTLLLALPALARVVVRTSGGERVVADLAERWVTATATGRLPAELLADRPVEERDRTVWQVTWAVPRDGRPLPGVVLAPTPTDEPCTVPALLVATFPLDPTRRHVAAGPVTDALVAHTGDVWADLLAACRDDGGTASTAPDPLDLVPVGLPAGPLDAALTEAVRDATRRSPVLEAADGGPRLVPREAVVVAGPGSGDSRLAGVLADHVDRLAVVAPRHRTVALRLGVEERDLAELVDTLPGEPATTCALLDAAGGDPAVLEQLAALAVPLADGRVVRGARGAVVPRDVPDGVLATLAGWGLRVVHPSAVHPALERLGAEVADAGGLAGHPALREHVLDEDDDPTESPTEDAADDDDVVPPAARVLLELVAGADRLPEPSPPWWGEALLPTADGDLVPARGLVLPGSPAERWFDDDVLAPVAPAVVHRWGPHVLRAVGVRDGLVVAPLAGAAEDVDLLADGLDGWDGWVGLLGDLAGEELAPERLDPPPVVVADLDAVRDAAWPEVLAALADGAARRALAPLTLGVAGGGLTRAPSYASWWLRERSPLALPPAFALPVADAATRRLLGPVPAALAGLDDGVLRLLGGVRSPAELDARAWEAVLARDGLEHAVPPAVALALWRALGVPGGPVPDHVPAVVGSGVRAVATDDVCVADPMWVQHPGVHPCVPVPWGRAEKVAADLDVPLAADRAAGRVTSDGAPAPVPGEVAALWPEAPTAWVEHEDLRVDGDPVDWWLLDGVVHAATLDGLARGIAALVGWGECDRVARVLAGAPVDAVVVDAAGDDAPGVR